MKHWQEAGGVLPGLEANGTNLKMAPVLLAVDSCAGLPGTRKLTPYHGAQVATPPSLDRRARVGGEAGTMVA